MFQSRYNSKTKTFTISGSLIFTNVLNEWCLGRIVCTVRQWTWRRGGGGVGGEHLFEARRLFTVNQSVAVLIFRVGTYSTFGAYSNKSSMQWLLCVHAPKRSRWSVDTHTMVHWPCDCFEKREEASKEEERKSIGLITCFHGIRYSQFRKYREN